MKTILGVSSLQLLRLFSVLSAAVLIYCTGLAANGRELESRISIAVLPLEDQTKDERDAHWRHSLPSMIAQPLKQVKQVRICMPEATEYGLRRFKLSPGEAVNAEQAKTIGEIIEARRVIWGYFGREGKNWTVTVKIMAVAEGKSSPEITATSDDWFTLTQQLAEKILTELKVTPTEEQKQKMKLRMTNSAEALECYSRAYVLMKDERPFAEISQMVKKAIKLDPKFANANFAYGSSLLNQGNTQQGRAQMEQVLALQPEYYQATMALGILAMLEQNLTDAAKYLRTAPQHGSDDTDPFIRLAEYHSLLNEYDKAAEQLEIAMKLNPVSAEVNAQFGLIYAYMAKKELAVRAMQNAVLIDSKDSGVHQKVAVGYQILGMTSQAIEYYEKFLASARKDGLDPKRLEAFETRLEELRTSLKTEYVIAAEPRRYTPEELRRELRERLTPEEFSQILYPLDTTPAMKQWAMKITKDGKDDMGKARALYDALAQHLSPAAGGSRTAQQVFEDWEKQDMSFRCQEYARLYVALAREVGLNAYFAPVSRDHNDKALMHACAALFLEGKVILVDVSYRWFGVPHKKFSIANDYESIVMQMNQLDGLAYKRIAVKLQPDSLSLFNLAGSLLSENETVEAKGVFERFLQTEGEPWMKHYALAALALIKEDWDTAEKELKQSIAISSTDGSTHFFLGVVLLKKQDFTGALDAFRTCIQAHPTADEEKQCRSLIARIHEKLAEANRTPSQIRKEKWRSELLEQSNSKFAFFEWIPMICPAAGLVYNTKSEAMALEIEALRQQSENEPENALCRYRMGFLLQLAMRDKESDLAMKDAEQVARTIMKSRPDDLDAMHVLVRCSQGKEEAGILANKAVQTHPSDWRAWMCLAYHQNENFMRALCEGLENLPPQGYDEKRLQAVFSVLSERPDECKKFIKMINECFATTEKAVELSKNSSQAWEYLLGVRNRLLDFLITLQKSDPSYVHDMTSLTKMNVKFFERAVQASQERPEALSVFAMFHLNWITKLERFEVLKENEVAAMHKNAEAEIEPVMKRLLELSEKDQASASAAVAYEGYAGLLLIIFNSGISSLDQLPKNVTERLTLAVTAAPKRIALWDLKIILESFNHQLNEAPIEICQKTALKRSEHFPTARSYAILGMLHLNSPKAIPYFKKAAILEPDHLFYALNLLAAQMRVDASEANLAELLKRLQEIGDLGQDNGYWQKHPDHDLYRLRLFTIHQALAGKMDASHNVLDKILERNPVDAQALKIRDLLNDIPE